MSLPEAASDHSLLSCISSSLSFAVSTFWSLQLIKAIKIMARLNCRFHKQKFKVDKKGD